tara:strand:+ start:179 stop:724 length:546 start_codon:yes stop_codon:yes gene_type:complete
VLGIASAILFTTIAMSEITNTKEYAKAYREVQQEYPEDSIQRKLPVGFAAANAYLETGGFKYKGADTAKAANNYHGMHAIGDQKFLTTSGGAKLAQYENAKESIRSFMNTMESNPKYSGVIESADKGVEEMLKGMSAYAEDPNYVEKLLSVYRNQIKSVLETENMLIPKVKPLDQQMNNLK